jgi:hypothetical protein
MRVEAGIHPPRARLGEVPPAVGLVTPLHALGHELFVVLADHVVP